MAVTTISYPDDSRSSTRVELRSQIQLKKSFVRELEASLDACFEKLESSTESRTPAPTLRFKFARSELDDTRQSQAQGGRIDTSDTSITPRTGISSSPIWNQAVVQSELVTNNFEDRDTSRLLVKEQFDEILEDPLDILTQLQETNGIEDYHRKFELLRNSYCVNFSEKCLVKAFLAGLRVDTEFNIRLFQPQTISHCLLVGRLYERAHPEDPIAKLNCLKETDGITEYHEQFQQISARVQLPESALVRVFLSGLKVDTQMYVSRLQPRTVHQCLVVGRLYERAHLKKTTIPQLGHIELIKEPVNTSEFIQDDKDLSGIKENSAATRAEMMKKEEPNPTGWSANEELTGIKDNSEATRAEIVTKEETSLDEMVVGAAITRETQTQLYKVNENLCCSVMTVENDSLLAKQTGREVEPDQGLKETVIQKDHTPQYRVDFVQAPANAVTERFGYDLKSADYMGFAMAEVLVHPNSHLKHKWRSKETSILSLFQAEKDLVFDNIETAEEITSEMEPGSFRECDSLVRNMEGRLEVLAVSVQAEGNTSMDHYHEHDDMALQTNKPLLPIETETNSVVELSKKMQWQEMGKGNTKQEEGEATLKAKTFAKQVETSDQQQNISDVTEVMEVAIGLDKQQPSTSFRTNRVWDPGGLVYTAEVTRYFFNLWLMQYSLTNLVVKVF